jgi:hypothetical protein
MTGDPPPPAAPLPVSLAPDQAKAVYTERAIIGCALKSPAVTRYLKREEALEIAAIYYYRNGDGGVDFADALFKASCFTDGKKVVRTFWWNGAHIRMADAPGALYNRDLLAVKSGLPVLITADAPGAYEAARLADFVPTCHPAGIGGILKTDAGPLIGREIYIYPDDTAASRKDAAALEGYLKRIAASAVAVEPVPEARRVRSHGAGIAEALEAVSPWDLSAYIRSYTPPPPALTEPEAARAGDPCAEAGRFLAGEGFFRIYDKKMINFYSPDEDREYAYSVIEKKFDNERIGDTNPAKAAIMIGNRNREYPVYRLVKSYGYPPLYRGEGAGGEYVINRWEGFQYPLASYAPDPDIEAEAELVKSHIRDIICGGNAEDYSYLCRWIAHLMKTPDIKPGVAVFAQSDVQGTGKSIIFERLIPNMLGIENTISFSNQDQISEKFNQWLFTSIYVVFSEQSFYANTENIKSWITEDHQGRRDMGVESRTEQSFARFVICTNRENAFRFEESERRMFVVSVSGKMALAPPEIRFPYFARLARAVRSAAVLDAMARFFLSIDIEGFNPFDIPFSAKKREIIEAERPPVISFFETVAYGEDASCKIIRGGDADPDGDNYHDSRKLYAVIRDLLKNGEYFIERKRLYDKWQQGPGRNRKETIGQFTRAIKNFYPPEKVEVIDGPIWEDGKTKRLPIIVIREAFFNTK